MDQLLTYADTVESMFQLGILAALWGIYTELRKRNERASKT